MDEDIDAGQWISNLMGNAGSQLPKGRQFFRPDQLSLGSAEIGRCLSNLLLHLPAKGSEFLIHDGIVNRQSCLLCESHDRSKNLAGDVLPGLEVICGNGSQSFILGKKGDDDKGMKIEFFFQDRVDPWILAGVRADEGLFLKDPPGADA